MAYVSTIRAIQVLRQGGVIAHQTDTVFGLASLPYEHLLRRLFQIKHRNNKQGYILLASDVTHLSDFICCTNEEIKILSEAQAKPTTWLVNAHPGIAPSLLGATDKIAVRITAMNSIQQISESLGPIVSTSANLSHQKTCYSSSQVRKMFGASIDYVDTASIPGTGQASKIIDLQTRQVIRN
ncbi:MAG: Sua5/YciO/YrdC/YwlC family protein [Pseudomonadota bacterium]